MKGNITATYSVDNNDILQGQYANQIANFIVLDDTDYENRVKSKENYQKYYKLHSYAEDNNNGKD